MGCPASLLPIKQVDEPQMSNIQLEDPKQYVWFFSGLTGQDAMRYLHEENVIGSFIIRESQNDPQHFSLAVLAPLDPKTRTTQVVHYKIYRIDSNHNQCYIFHQNQFNNLNELVEFYSKSANGLATKLTRPCHRRDLFQSNEWYEKDRESIEKLDNEPIYDGQFSRVYIGSWCKHQVAIKEPKTNEERDMIMKEYEILKTLKHEKIINLMFICLVGDPILIGTEYMTNGSLKTYLTESSSSSISENSLSFSDLIDMATQIANGMMYIESKRIVHRDLAARNLLVGENNLVKISDFGLSEILPIGQDGLLVREMKNKKLAIKWMAPETYDLNKYKNAKYTIKSDVWSFGIVLYEIITLGGDPYPSMTNEEVREEIILKNYRMPKPKGFCDDSYYSIMLKCWEANPEKRDSFQSLLEYFKKYPLSTN